ncbi:hypothetical protein SAMD00023353_0702820 [Rosellinia necatrix]|uniref:Uncharacterized protein n=1 Tax=Rosellinia necatrix TaxID=77044 RepID=A0A1S8A5X4_ROSNE|nr:hypothetical protein SAMD00023353_0702820 [Rosellinia necatrix]
MGFVPRNGALLALNALSLFIEGRAQLREGAVSINAAGTKASGARGKSGVTLAGPIARVTGALGSLVGSAGGFYLSTVSPL